METAGAGGSVGDRCRRQETGDIGCVERTDYGLPVSRHTVIQWRRGRCGVWSVARYSLLTTAWTALTAVCDVHDVTHVIMCVDHVTVHVLWCIVRLQGRAERSNCL